MADALAAINKRRTAQTEQADPKQVKNNAGGFTFAVDEWARLDRFLLLGTDGGTYYSDQADLTRENAKIAFDLAEKDGTKVVERLVDISLAGRAPRQNATLFTLAAVSAVGDDVARRAAHDAIPYVCRTATHLFLFVKYAEQFRGWGRGLARGVAGWYEHATPDFLIYQGAKYKSREGWTHRDVLRSSHPKAAVAAEQGEDVKVEDYRAVYDWLAGREPAKGTLMHKVDNLHKAKDVDDLKRRMDKVANLVSWEMLPTKFHNEPDVWRWLIANDRVPVTALLRQLPRLTKLGLLTPLAKGNVLNDVIALLTEPSRVHKSRVHPINVLVAMKTYASGYSVAGDNSWTPEGKIVAALDKMFYVAFDNVESTGKKTLIAVDISGSMGHTVSGLPNLTCREAAVALAMVTERAEDDALIFGFASQSGRSTTSIHDTSIRNLGITGDMRLVDAMNQTAGIPFGGTDCSLPMQIASQQDWEVDTFIVLTDNETYAGSMHPHQALKEYRRKSGRDARLIVVSMTASGFSIADPNDAGMLDVVGFDSAVPGLISSFSKG